MPQRYRATQEGLDHWQYAGNTNTHNHTTQNITVNGNYIDNGSSKQSLPLYRSPRKRFRDWPKAHRWIFAAASGIIITAVVVLCVLLSTKHTGRTVRPSTSPLSTVQPTVDSAFPSPTAETTASTSPTTQSSPSATTPSPASHSILRTSAHPSSASSPSPTPTLPAQILYLSDGAPCTANSQCRPPNPCQTASGTNTINNEVYTLTTCCASTLWGCPGWRCADYNDCLDPWKCAGKGSVSTCCGIGAPFTGAGC